MIVIICNNPSDHPRGASSSSSNFTAPPVKSQHSTFMPATIVTRPDLKSKIPTHYKRYETRSLTNPQVTRTTNGSHALTENHYTSKLVKPGQVPPGLPVGHRTTELKSVKTSILPEEGTQDNKPVDIEEGASSAATTAADSLYDIQQSYRDSEHFTPSMFNGKSMFYCILI